MKLNASCRPRENQSERNTATVAVPTSTQHLEELDSNAQPEFLFAAVLRSRGT